MVNLVIAIGEKDTPSSLVEALPYYAEVREGLRLLNQEGKRFAATSGFRAAKRDGYSEGATVYEWRTSSKDLGLYFCRIPDNLRDMISIMLDYAFRLPDIEDITLRRDQHDVAAVFKSATSTEIRVVFQFADAYRGGQ